MKKGLIYCLIFSLIWNNIAFATHEIIELDFKDSQTPQRLHMIPRLPDMKDISHIEIDTKKRLVAVYRKDNQPQKDQNTSSAHLEAIKRHPVLVRNHDIHGICWEKLLTADKMLAFLRHHTAWLTLLGEDGYKLAFKGSLLGGGGDKPWEQGGGWKKSDFEWDSKSNSYIPVVTIYADPPKSGGQSNMRSGPIISVPSSGLQNIVKGIFSGSKGSNVAPPKHRYEIPKSCADIDYDIYVSKVLPWMGDYENWGNAVKVGRKLTQERRTKEEEVRRKQEMAVKKQQEERQTEMAEMISPYFQSYYPSLKEVRYDSSISKVEYGETSQIRPLSFFEKDFQEAKDKRVLDPYIESWNKLYPQWAKKHYYELISDPKTGYKSGMTAQEANKVYETWYQGRYEQTSSQEGSLLFKDVSSQYKVTPEYFAKSAFQAGMSSSQALKMILNPAPENFYDRVILASRQSWLGGPQNTTAFDLEDITNEQAYQYIFEGYKPPDFPTLSNRLISQGVASLFDITPDYFIKSAEITGLKPKQAIDMILNPTLDNAYNRVLLASRQNYLGGSDNLFVFQDIGVSVGEAYDNLLSHLKNNESFSQLLDDRTNKTIKEGFTQFCCEKREIKEQIDYLITSNPKEVFESDLFDDQLLEDWKRESNLEGANLLQVASQTQIIREIVRYGVSKGKDFVKQGWKKIGQSYKGDMVKGLKIDQKTLNKIPKEFGEPKISRNGQGLRWEKDNGNHIRISKGDPHSDFPHKRVDHARITINGKVIKRDGTGIIADQYGVKTKQNADVHIPLEELHKVLEKVIK